MAQFQSGFFVCFVSACILPDVTETCQSTLQHANNEDASASTPLDVLGFSCSTRLPTYKVHDEDLLSLYACTYLDGPDFSGSNLDYICKFHAV